MMRTSIGSSTVSPTRRTFFSWITRSSFTCIASGRSDLPLAMQVKLLRVIQEKKVRRVGDTVEDPIDVRIISATHRSLSEQVDAGEFRQDLFYRLNVIELKMPSLREIPED